MKIGVDDHFHNVAWVWNGRTLNITRGEDWVTRVVGVLGISEEHRLVPASDQAILFVRFLIQGNGVRALFIDDDCVQTNVREVSPDLLTLDDVLLWLLPPDYTRRQGDVGVYRRTALPPGLNRINADEYPEHFSLILSKRHALQPITSCEFYVGNNRYYVVLDRAARLVHPEHSAIDLESGIYELIGARGQPLPQFVGLREGEISARAE